MPTSAHRIRESRNVSTGFPNFRRHDDGRFEAGDVVALAGHGVPPKLLDVALEFRAERAVIPKAVDAAVNLRRLKNEPAPLAQRHDFFHLQILFWIGHRANQCLRSWCRCKSDFHGLGADGAGFYRIDPRQMAWFVLIKKCVSTKVEPSVWEFIGQRRQCFPRGGKARNHLARIRRGFDGDGRDLPG